MHISAMTIKNPRWLKDRCGLRMAENVVSFIAIIPVKPQYLVFVDFSELAFLGKQINIE